MALSTGIRISAGAGAAAPVLFWLVVIAAGAVTPGYSHVTETISALAEQGAPFGWIMRTGGVAVGAMLMLFALAIGAEFRSRTAAGLVALGGGCMAVGIGFVNCDPGCPLPPVSGSGVAHAILALILFATYGIVPIVVARRLSRRTWLRGFSFACGLASLTMLVLAFALAPTSVMTGWVGLSQRLNVFVELLWVEVIGLDLLLRRSANAPHTVLATE